MATLIEEYRKACVQDLFTARVFNSCFSTWKSKIDTYTPHKNANEYYDLGDHLKEIFFSTNTGDGRGQASLSGGGASWEALVCWYLNLCNIGRRTIIIKHKKNLIPACVSDSITVNYGNFPSNTESDLIAITFPDKPEYSTDVSRLVVTDVNGNNVNTMRRNGILDIKRIIDALGERDFSDLEINIIQCKTNWNDNAQIPMLWDMIYSARRFATNITVGRNGFSIQNVKYFSYSFVTVPSNKDAGYNPSATSVKRVENLSGGNYWGLPTKPNVAASIKEILLKNLNNGNKNNHKTTLAIELTKLKTDYSYFRI